MDKEYLKSKVSLTATIVSLKINVPTSIKNRDIKAGNLKSTISFMSQTSEKLRYLEKPVSR